MNLRTVTLAVIALVVVAIAVSAAGARPAAAPLVTLTIWMIGVGAYREGTVPGGGLREWVLASAAGLVAYFGLDLLAAALARAGMLPVGLLLGFAANVTGVLIATFAAKLLVHRSSRTSPARPISRSDRARTEPPFRTAHAPAEPNRMRREIAWFVGAAAGFSGFVVVVVLAEQGARWPTAVEWLEGVAAVYGLVSALRVTVWTVRGGAQTFRHWPEVGMVVGVCLLAYGSLGVIAEDGADGDRYVATFGAGLSAASVVVRRRTAVA